MDPKLVKQCEVILCSFLANHVTLSTRSWSYCPSTCLPVYQMLPRFLEPFFFLIFYVTETWMMFDNCRKKCKLFSGSLLLLLPLVILTKHIIEFFQQNVWYYYMLDDKNNCPMNDSMKLCILDLLSCELALFSIIIFSLLFYTVHVHFK